MFEEDREGEDEPQENAEENEESSFENDMWEVIMDDTVDQYNDQLQNYIEDSDVLKKKFEKYFFENVRKWMHMLYSFFEGDDVFGKIVEFVKNIDHADDDEEALNLAVDNHKYKLLKVVDWQRVFNLINTRAEEEEDEECLTGNGRIV